MSKRRFWLLPALLLVIASPAARADNRVIVRTTGGLLSLQALCLLPTTCTVVGPLDGSLGQVFLITTPLDLTTILNLLSGVTGFVDAEVDQLLNLVGTQNLLPSPLPNGLLSDRTTVTYSGAMVWNAYANQPAASDIHLPQAQSTFNLFGAGIVADIDTGVDPNHPVLQPVLLPGYDFTRNQAGGSEMNDLSASDFPTFPPPACDSTTCPSPAVVNQSSAAILDQSSAAILDQNTNYAAFGHGTMVMGVIHLVAPQAQLLPLKAFGSDGTGYLSDILRAIYYAVQNNAKVINMSFSLKAKSPDTELQKALDYAGQLTLICAASAGNDGSSEPDATGETVFPAAIQSDVMGVASVSTVSPTSRSSFSNYGNSVVWVAAPGEAIVTTYPFSTYSAGWGTSFSAPVVSGGAALLVNLQPNITASGAATAIANADPLDPSLGLNHGLLDLVKALQVNSGGSTNPDFTMAVAPSSTTIDAGQTANFSLSVSPVAGFKGAVSLTCSGAPNTVNCTIAPQVVLDGTNPATATLTLTTTARSVTTPLAIPRTDVRASAWNMTAPLCILLLVMLVLLWNLSRIPVQRLCIRRLAASLAVALCAYACRGGYGGTGNSSAATLYSLALSPASVQGGKSTSGSVTLSGPAPSGGAAVNLSSSNTATVTVPGTVIVAAGANSATFTITTAAVTSSTAVTISASFRGATSSTTLTVTPPSGTPAGTYTITATGTSRTVTHSTTTQVTVN